MTARDHPTMCAKHGPPLGWHRLTCTGADPARAALTISFCTKFVFDNNDVSQKGALHVVIVWQDPANPNPKPYETASGYIEFTKRRAASMRRDAAPEDEDDSDYKYYILVQTLCKDLMTPDPTPVSLLGYMPTKNNPEARTTCGVAGFPDAQAQFYACLQSLLAAGPQAAAVARHHGARVVTFP